MFLIDYDVSFIFDDFRIVVPVSFETATISAGYDLVDDGSVEMKAHALLSAGGVVLPDGWFLDTAILGFRGGYAVENASQ